MKNILTFFAGLLLSVSMVFGGFATTEVFAASNEAQSINGAQYLFALKGYDDNGNKILMAVYCRQDGVGVAYVNDGRTHVYQKYTISESTYEGIGSVVKFTLKFDYDDYDFNFYHNMSGKPCLITEKGRIYVCEYMTEYEVEHAMIYGF